MLLGLQRQAGYDIDPEISAMLDAEMAELKRRMSDSDYEPPFWAIACAPGAAL
jgi:hypothetical protein